MKTIKNILLASALTLVFAGCAGNRYHRSTGVYIDDKATTAKVKTDLFADPCVKGSEVKVEVYGGKVQLSGFCDTQIQKDRAAEIARRIGGVQWVKNDLIVKSAMPQQCYAITTTSRGTVNESAGAQAPANNGGINAGVNVGPVGAGASVGGGQGVGAGAHVGSVGAGASVGGSNTNP
jgi:hypothetical protein